MKNRIKEIRLSENLTLKYISYVSNVSPSYIHQLESGKRENPSYQIMKKISKALNKPINLVFFL